MYNPYCHCPESSEKRELILIFALIMSIAVNVVAITWLRPFYAHVRRDEVKTREVLKILDERRAGDGAQGVGTAVCKRPAVQMPNGSRTSETEVATTLPAGSTPASSSDLGSNAQVNSGGGQQATESKVAPARSSTKEHQPASTVRAVRKEASTSLVYSRPVHFNFGRAYKGFESEEEFQNRGDAP